MNYYTGKQVLIFCSITALVALGAVLGAQALIGPQTTIASELASMPQGNSGNATINDPKLQGVNNDDTFSEDEKNNIEVYASYSASVVNISTEVINYDLFFEPYPSKGGTGSGSIIDKRGYIVTNYHVVEGATRLYVTLASGDRLEAKIVGVDPENDLAVIKIDAGNRTLTIINLGTSANLRVGQKAIAIGNPFSLDRTMTTGIISALGRPIQTSKNRIIQGMIQTDASINPGNSGGPLLDRKGNMIGINTMIYSESGGSIGLGFAIPIDTARRVVSELIQYGVVKRGWIDVVPIQIFPELARYANLPVEEGILISQISAGGAAERAGIKGGRNEQAVRYGRTIIYLGGDIITEVDGVPTRTIADLFQALEDNKPGQVVKVKVMRGSNYQEFNVTLSQRLDQSK